MDITSKISLNFFMKSEEEFNELAVKIESMMSRKGATTGSVYLDLTDRGEDISPRDFVSSLLVGLGTSLPETAILVDDFPAIEYIRHMPLEDQERFVRKEESFEFLVISRSGFSTQMRTYKQLNDLDCQQLFEAGSDDSLGTCVQNIRTLEKALANPDRDYLIKLKY